MSLQEETTQQLRAIVAAIDEGQLVATPRQRAYLVGAMEAQRATAMGTAPNVLGSSTIITLGHVPGVG